MKKNIRGFTLIELIAVIIVLGIIGLIAITVVGNVVEEFRRNAYKTSVLHLFDAIETYTYMNGNSELINDGMEVKKVNTLDKNPFKTGIIFLNKNGNYEISEVSDGNYCASGEKESINVIKGACDVEKPTISTTVNKNVASIVFTDNKELAGYACVEGIEEPSIWNEISGKEQTITCTFESENTYSIWVKDTSNNKNREEIIITKASFCDYEEGHIWTYNYTGGSQSFITPCDGIYKLEVWGAQGGNAAGQYETYGANKGSCTSIGGYGAYSYGNISLLTNNTLYIYVGSSSGYNGGAKGGSISGCYYDWGYCSSCSSGSGGGASDIRYNGTSLADRIIVAGGGGGASSIGGWGSGSSCTNGYSRSVSSGVAGTGVASSNYNAGDDNFVCNGAGGGGYYGGNRQYAGTSYLSPTLSLSKTTENIRLGHGTAKITLVTLN